MRRVMAVTAGAVVAILMSAGPALACGGLIGPNGAVNLTRTTTFAGYANGVEHYVTAFNFVGGSGKFGSITPLPGVPTKIERGGDWTLQRLVRETEPVRDFALTEAAAPTPSAPASAQVLLTAKVDALDITVLKGNGAEVGRWAKEHGFKLPPDSPEVLDFYARRSPIFMAAAFDADRAKAKGQRVGDGTPLHLTIPTKQPWVPLRILGLGKAPTARITADVYLLTERRPAMLPAPTPANLVTGPGLVLSYDQPANAQLLRDLHDDKSGLWVPLQNMWLTKVVVADTAGALKYDLAIDQSGGKPSIEAAGYTVNGLPLPGAQPGQSGAVAANPAATAPLKLNPSLAADASTRRPGRGGVGGLIAVLVVGFAALVVGATVARARATVASATVASARRRTP